MAITARPLLYTEDALDASFRARGRSPHFVARAVAASQGLYFLITGIWPLVSIKSFQAVTGPKTDHLVTGREGDHWLVMTVAALVVAISLPLLSAAWRNRVALEMSLLGMSAALALGLIDIIYVSRGALPPIYLLDALAEGLLLIGWIFAAIVRR